MQCAVRNIRGDPNTSPSLPLPNYKWKKNGVTIIDNGTFTPEFAMFYPAMQNNFPVPVIISRSDSITLLLKPQDNSSSKTQTLSCQNHMFKVNLEDSFFLFAAGNWSCEAENIYGKDVGHLEINEQGIYL